MLLVAGIDPGVGGAIALYDFDADRLFGVYKLPNYKIMVGKKERTRLDEEELRDLFRSLAMMGVRFAVIENVQGGNYSGKKQSAAGAFQFGYTYGLLRMACMLVGIEHTTASPAVWKLTEMVPVTAAAIVKKADAEFPEHKKLFHAPKGAALHDRADAAFLSRYAARRIWPSQQPRAGLRTLALGVAKKVKL